MDMADVSSPPLTLTRVTAGVGQFVLPSSTRHRILVHKSVATRTSCKDTGRVFVRRSGDIDILPAGQAGGFESEAHFETLQIGLSPEILARAQAAPSKVERHGLETRHMVRDERVIHLSNALEAMYHQGMWQDDLYADSIGLALSVILLGSTFARKEPGKALSAAQLHRVLEFLDAEMHCQLTVDSLSRVAGVSPSHFRSLFKATTGATVHQFVLHRRVEKARLLALQGDISLDEIAHLTGFAHQSHLAYWMRRKTGQTPGELKRRRTGF